MGTEPLDNFPLQTLLQQEKVTALYQPIISFKRKSLAGFEGLIRGIHPETGETVSPFDLFHAAVRQNNLLELDRLCRRKVLELFKPVHGQRSDLILSVNFEASVANFGVVGSGHLIQMVRDLGLNPGNICIEIIESNVDDLDALQRFVTTYRGYGFLIALDDVGAGHSNLNRIPLLKPDIVKIDRYLVQDIQGDFYKQEVFKSLVNMCRTLGALIVAEGVETKEEALVALQLGADMIQGYYFAKPQTADTCLVPDHGPRIVDLAAAYKEKEIEKINVKRFNLMQYHSMIGELQQRLASAGAEGFDETLSQMSNYYPAVECFFILDEAGNQVTETYLNSEQTASRNPQLFYPAVRGADHTLKDYYFVLMEAGLGKINYISEPYLSLASGHMCVTLSALFRAGDKKRYILCLDINIQDFAIREKLGAI